MEPEFPQKMSQQPDCQRCEPANPYFPTHKAPIRITNMVNGGELRVCVVCLQEGIGLEELEPQINS